MTPTSKSNSATSKHSKESAERDFLLKMSAPARGAFIHHGITTLQKVAAYTEKEILKLHGVGPKTIPTLQDALKEAGLSFKQQITNNQK